ncbi:hypothetical protein V2J09_014872 [Rumex salicifolius]
MASINAAMCIASNVPDASKAVSVQNGLKAHLGLRPVNNVDMIKWRTNNASISKLPKFEEKRKMSGKTSNKGAIRCGMNLVFVSAEVAPWSKTGGLGDVLSGLPPAMAANGHRVMTISPRYDQYQDAWDTSVETQVWGKTGFQIYGPRAGEDYEDNQLRFREDVFFVANDWHTAPLPCYLKSMYKSRGIYNNAKVAFCIHNISYQGRFAPTDFNSLNLPDEFKRSFEFYDGPYYAEEVISGAERGVELEKVIRSTGIVGILNGMDKQEWNPSSDKFINYNYDASTVLEAKPLIKEALQAELGLPVDRNIPLIGFIGRLEEQKGSDILVKSIPEFINENVQIVILGTGKKRFERQIEELEMMYPNKARGLAAFNPSMAHKINAGIPICASTGGLVDSVKEGITGFHMGRFSAQCKAVDPADVAALVRTVRRAVGVHGTPTMREMILNCMSRQGSGRRCCWGCGREGHQVGPGLWGKKLRRWLWKMLLRRDTGDQEASRNYTGGSFHAVEDVVGFVYL